MDSPLRVFRNSCYIGKSMWSQDPLVNADFDELKFYNRSLTDSEIFQDFNNTYPILTKILD